jgi:hypothetical protein
MKTSEPGEEVYEAHSKLIGWSDGTSRQRAIAYR